MQMDFFSCQLPVWALWSRGEGGSSTEQNQQLSCVGPFLILQVHFSMGCLGVRCTFLYSSQKKDIRERAFEPGILLVML